MKKQKVSTTTMYAFCRSQGMRPRTGVSIYTLATSALAKLGHAKPADISERAHCLASKSVMEEYARPFRVARKGSTTAPRVYIVASEKPAFDGDVMSDTFLQTYEWRRVRMLALKKHGARCQCCGASPSTGAVIKVDHIKPRRLFPALALDLKNLQVLCHDCNHGKGNWDMTDWRPSEESAL